LFAGWTSLTSAAEPVAGPKTPTATQRWERLKSQYGGVAPTELGTAAAPREARAAVNVAPELPLDDAAPKRELRSSTNLLPLPIEDEAPRWVLSQRPLPVEAPVAPPEQPAVIVEEPAAKALVADMIESAEVTTQVVANDALLIQAQPTTPVVPAPMNRQINPETGRRRVRQMAEISPFYDTTVDSDIRNYADSRAADYDVKFGGRGYEPRVFADTVFAWHPSNFHHYPLYFEDVALERYGHTYHPLVQPFVSIGRFSGQLVMLPYQMTLDPINKEVYALGYYRPGDCAPKLRYQVPWNGKAAAVEVGVLTGLFFLIP
jgi:hypothetical protein